jgi:hypothetical protein
VLDKARARAAHVDVVAKQPLRVDHHRQLHVAAVSALREVQRELLERPRLLGRLAELVGGRRIGKPQDFGQLRRRAQAAVGANPHSLASAESTTDGVTNSTRTTSASWLSWLRTFLANV